MKKILAILLTVVISMGNISTNVAYASTETRFYGYTNIELNQSYNFTKYPYSSNKVKFEVPKKGYITIKSSKPTYKDGSFANIYIGLYNKNNDRVKNINTRDFDYIMKSQNSFKIGIEPGTYYLDMYTTGESEEYPFSIDYQIDFTADEYYETEPNDNYPKGTATLMALEQEYRGVLDLDTDWDVFKLSVDKFTKVQLRLKYDKTNITNPNEIFFLEHSTPNGLVQTFNSLGMKSDNGWLTYILYLKEGENYIKLNHNEKLVEYSVKLEEKTNNKPEIIAQDATYTVGEYEYSIDVIGDLLKKVQAVDAEDGDISKKVKVIEDNINVNVAGEYKVVLQVEDSDKNKTTKEIKVIIKEAPVVPIIEIKDKYLLKAINQQLGRGYTEEKVNQKDLESLRALTDDKGEISDLTGLEYAKNLETLRITDAKIIDIKPVANLKKLLVLDLGHNNIKNIEPISQLTLESLRLSYNQIEDISPLVSCDTIYDLQLNFNNIKDISALSQMDNLDTVELTNNQIADLTPISQTKLTYARLSDQSINLGEIKTKDKEIIISLPKVYNIKGQQLKPYVNNSSNVQIVGDILKYTNNGKNTNLQINYSDTVQVGNNTDIKYNLEVKQSILVTVIETKLVGDTRYQTAIKVSNRGWENNSAQNVVLVNSSAIVDALSATPFAKQENAPILLTEKDNLTGETLHEIQRLSPKRVYIIGGVGVVSKNVENKLKSYGYDVERISGDTRFETSLAIAKKIKNVSQIAVVNGETGLPDAVSIAPVAADKNMPIVLASPRDGVSVFKDYIKENKINKAYIIGGERAISQIVASSLPNPERLGGNNRSETNALIIDKFYTNKELKNIFVAKDGIENQNGLIDALAVGVLASKESSPVVIVGKSLDQSQRNVLLKKEPREITQIGGNGNENAYSQIISLY